MNKNFLLLAALQIFSAVASGQDNLAFRRAVYQSSSIDFDKCGHLSVDGCESSYWQAKGNEPAWIYVDLGEVSQISGFTLLWGDNGSECYKIEGSVQRVRPDKWDEIYTCGNGNGTKDEIILSKSVEARFVRLFILEKQKAREGVSVREFRILGKNPVQRNASPVDLAAGDWKIEKAQFVDAAGEVISTPGYDDSRWLAAKVPGTIMNSYVTAGALPDPYYGDQMEMISEEFFSRSDFWYRTSFPTPDNHREKSVRLNFDGVNWRSQVFVNGRLLGEINGAFLRKSFDVTDLLTPGGKNYVAVHILKLDNPGPSNKDTRDRSWDRTNKIKVLRKHLGAPTSNGDVLTYDSPTFSASAGWNWLPIVRGRELGIWNHVRLTVDGGVRVVDPWIESSLNLPDTTTASLVFRTDLLNDRDVDVKGVLKIKIGEVTVERPEIIPAGTTKQITLTKDDFPQLEIANPRLWWPNGYGAQNLYRVNVVFEAEGVTLDAREFNLGIRDLRHEIDNSVLYFCVNGYRMLLRGGNWGMAEGMLNCDSAGYDLRVRLHKEANFNMIRNWVGQTGHSEFYDACDRYGILVFDDFWLANPGDGPDPLNFEMFLDNAADKVRNVRSHPSLAFYCGRNEGNPPQALDSGLREIVRTHDPSRHYESNSAAGNLTGFGPYNPKEIEWYFSNRGTTFHSELGIIAIPETESMKAMMPEEYWWPINDMWAIHDYQSPRSNIYTKYINRKYGFTDSLEDYCRKAQLANMEVSKAMFESFRSQQGSGLLLWMSQSAWPSLICQMYDHYFEMTGAYFGIKRACEPVHILFNAHTHTIEAVNNSTGGLNGVKYEVEVYDLDGRRVMEKTGEVSVPVGVSTKCIDFEPPAGQKGKVYFLKLRLKSADQIIAENFYWSEDSDGTSLALQDVKKAELNVSLVKEKRMVNGKERVRVKIGNGKNGVALMIRLKIADKKSGERILPVTYTDNYISLLPGESCEATVEYDAMPSAVQPVLRVEGWNVDQKEILIK